MADLRRRRRRDQAVACVDAAFDAGINFVDTANVYARGAAEEFLGEVLASRPRDSYVLATKLFFPMSDTDRGLSREQVHKQLDASLRGCAPTSSTSTSATATTADAARGDDGAR